ncbi:MAG: ribonuclease [Muribaculaceae bacterium]|nr:endonuclease [Muribaculaceae bacterium]MCI9055465.1 ribonuclease [Muribaculaceae bacterium]
MKKLFASILALCACLCALAEAPDGYYQSLNGKKDADLKNAIYQLVHNFTQVSSYNNLPRYFERTDVYPDSRQWWDMYGNTPLYLPWSGTLLNREHSFPKSWWGGSTGIPAYVDLNHLYPADAAANQAKSNWPLGKVDMTASTKYNNGVSIVGYPVTGQGGGSQSVFEPADEYKGDFARTYFYMVTCYQDLTWATKYAWMMEQNTYPTLKGWASKLLLEWHRNDPVSEKEINRNEVVYSIQNNRNPFIDHPELAEYIWGNKVGQTFNGGSGSQQPTGDPNLVTPTNDMALEFSQVAIGRSTTAILQFRGENLTGNFELILSGSDKGMFSIPSTKLSTSLVNQPDGTQITVTYTPTAIGKHEASLIIVDGGITGSRIVRLIGECLEVPTLTACTATDPTDITNDSYRANWTYPANETVDYWVINRTRYVSGTATAEEVLAEAPGTIIEDFDQSDSESYSVQSVRLGYRSPASNVVFVAHAGITGVQADQGLVVQGFDGIMRFICSAEQTGACIYDISGKLVMFIDTIHNNMDIDIPAGIYLVTTDQCHTPVKVAVK